MFQNQTPDFFIRFWKEESNLTFVLNKMKENESLINVKDLLQTQSLPTETSIDFFSSLSFETQVLYHV